MVLRKTQTFTKLTVLLKVDSCYAPMVKGFFIPELHSFFFHYDFKKNFDDVYVVDHVGKGRGSGDSG